LQQQVARLYRMEDINKETLKVVYLPIEGAQNVWMYTTILALTIFVYFLLKGIRSMWNEVPRFGARSMLRQMYSVNNGVGDGWACIHGAGGFALTAPLASTSNSDSTSTQVRRNAHSCPTEAPSVNGSGECA
uniref:Rhomboid-like protein n=1 Tax=Taenia asiatica TaxID=60517 RepID=A0A0R3W5F2_TAEAS